MTNKEQIKKEVLEEFTEHLEQLETAKSMKNQKLSRGDWIMLSNEMISLAIDKASQLFKKADTQKWAMSMQEAKQIRQQTIQEIREKLEKVLIPKSELDNFIKSNKILFIIDRKWWQQFWKDLGEKE